MSSETLQSTALSSVHIALGAKMVPFAGYNMPVSYSGLNEEHATVRNAVGVFDVSHMGEFILKGEHALDLIQRVTSNDASVLTDGKAQYPACQMQPVVLSTICWCTASTKKHTCW